MKCLITGGAGFIGSHVQNLLIDKGHDVIVLDDLSAGKKERVNPKATFVKADIRNLEEIKPHFVGVDVVFHLAGLPNVQYSIEHPKKSHEINVDGTLNVLMASTEAVVKKLIYSGSASVYGEKTEMPLVETMLPDPMSPYALQKYCAEVMCQTWSHAYKLETVCLRYFNVYGPSQPEEGAYALVIARFLRQKREGKKMTITGDGLQTRDFVHVRDVARANVLAMESEKVGNGEVINIGTHKEVSVLEIAKIIGGEYEFIEARLEPRRSLAENQKAKDLLGWEPKEDFEKGVEELKK